MDALNFERKGLAESLQEQIEFSEKLVHYSAVPTFVIDKEHYVIFWNRACEELTGMRASDIVGTDKHWTAFYERKRPCLADIVISDEFGLLPDLYEVHGKSLLIADGLHAEGWYASLNGKRRYISFDAAPIRNRKGGLLAVIETLQDITERKSAEEEKENLILELQDALGRVRTLSGLLPLCAWCKKIRDDKGYWDRLEAYIEKYTDATFTHGICPECLKQVDRDEA